MLYPQSDVEFARHIIEYDPNDPTTFAAWSISRDVAETLARRQLAPIPWPKKLAPKPRALAHKPAADSPLPPADCLVVTWTVAEAQALADVLTPGKSKGDWYPYLNRYGDYVPKIRAGAPARNAKRLGSYFPVRIGDHKVLCFKSELHMSQDGPKLPIRDLWKQIISESGARLVITTGTAGAIGAAVNLGDVLISRQVRFDCLRTFKNAAFHAQSFSSTAPIPAARLKFAQTRLVSANAAQLPAGKPVPRLIRPGDKKVPKNTVVTTDFFAFDTGDNAYGLQGLGAAVEMGDAVLGMVCANDLAAGAPAWLAIRNASDPQIPKGMSLPEQRKQAAQIYEKYGYWTTVVSAIATWAAIAGS